MFTKIFFNNGDSQIYRLHVKKLELSESDYRAGVSQLVKTMAIPGGIVYAWKVETKEGKVELCQMPDIIKADFIFKVETLL